MATFKLDKHTSVDFALFKKFATFIAQLKYGFNKRISVNDYFGYMAELLRGPNDNIIGPESVQNIFIETHPFAEIEESRFKAFCENFVAIFKNLSLEKQKNYEKVMLSFEEWFLKLYDDNKWDWKEKSERIIQIEDEKQSPVSTDVTSKTILDWSTDAFAENISNLALEIKQQLKNLYSEISSSGESFFEAWACDAWLRALFERMDFEKISSREEQIKSLHYRVMEELGDGWFDIYTLENEFVIKQTIQIKTKKSDAYIVKGTFEGTQQDLLHGHFEYDIQEKTLYLLPNNGSSNDPVVKYCYIFFKAKTSHIQKMEFYKGVKLRMNGFTEMELKLAVLDYEVDINEQFYKVMKYTPSDVSFKIRSFLIESEANYPKHLFFDDVIPAVVNCLKKWGLVAYYWHE